MAHQWRRQRGGKDTGGRGPKEYSLGEQSQRSTNRVGKQPHPKTDRLLNKCIRNALVWSISVQFFVTSWTATCQASLSFTISQSLLKLMSTELMMPAASKHKP